MSAQFVAHVLSYCLGKGTLSLKGTKRRPWLEIVRSETEHTYLSSQLKPLRKFSNSPIDCVRDRVETDGFYDKERVRLHCEDLWHVYELLYPRDEKVFTRQLLDMCGMLGAVSLWLDCGQFVGRCGRIRNRYKPEEAGLISSWLSDLGYDAKPVHASETSAAVGLSNQSTTKFIADIRPITHSTMKHRLRRPKK
jgi:hypothetical protein